MSIGDRVKERRLYLGYSAEQVAEKLGISPATEYRYENGDISKMPAKLIAPLAELLSTSPAYLMGWSDEVIPDSISNLKEDEKHLVSVWREASAEPKEMALMILEKSAEKNRQKKDVPDSDQTA